MNAYLVDDESINLELLKYQLNKHCPDVLIVGQSDNFTDAVLGIQKNQVDVLFLDVELGDGQSGFKVVDALRHFKGAVIFITAHEGYALQAFRYGATHYILKPINPVELVVAVNRVREYHKANAAGSAGNPDQKIGLPFNKGIEMVAVDDIIYVEGQGSYAKVVMKGERTLTMTKNLKSVLEQFSEYPQFMRVHKSFLVNQKHMVKFLRPATIELSNQKLIPVSDPYKEEVTKLFA